MRLSIAAAALSFASGVLATGQVPVVNGVIGGVGNKTLKADSKVVSFATKPGTLRTVENSGICETTKGVYQASGYGDLTAQESIFFWYFDARNNASNAPLAIWINGGPGSSSMIGLLQENGPCRIANNSRTVSNNPYSWNTNVNMLYIDQPVGTGFSHGTETVGTSAEAAADLWTFMQIFLKDSRFSHLVANGFAIWTESYGGHYGPAFASYILSQNAAIAKGTISGITIKLTTLGIGNGLTDGLSQYPGYISYATSNPYGQMVSTSTIRQATTALTSCKSQITRCNAGGSDTVCSNAQSYCNNNILSALIGNHDVYYVPSGTNDPYPPDITSYLNSVQTAVGAESTWQMTNDNVYFNFANTGDWMRSQLPNLESVADSGVRVVLYNGDADFIVNYQGVEDMLAAMKTSFSTAFNNASFKTYTVNGKNAGLFKTTPTFSYVRVSGAGHEVPAYQNINSKLAVGEAAFQMFTQTMQNQALFST